MTGVQIGQKQAREFALLIYKDIHKFCEEHKEEFEAFLRIEQNKEPKPDAEKDKRRVYEK